jgi:hypothetical protein
MSLQDLIRKTHMHRNDANKGKVNATCTLNQKAINYKSGGAAGRLAQDGKTCEGEVGDRIGQN